MFADNNSCHQDWFRVSQKQHPCLQVVGSGIRLTNAYLTIQINWTNFNPVFEPDDNGKNPSSSSTDMLKTPFNTLLNPRCAGHACYFLNPEWIATIPP